MTTRRRSPSIADFMTPSPHSVAVDRKLADAHRLMLQYRIRHLPVLEGGRLVGIVTERDLALLETRNGINRLDVEVEEAMSPDVFVVTPDTPLLEVSLQMWKHKWGSAVVMDGREVAGVFTTVDAMRALASMLAVPPPNVARAERRKPAPAKPTPAKPAAAKVARTERRKPAPAKPAAAEGRARSTAARKRA